MQAWIKIVKLCDLDPQKSYFIARTGHRTDSVDFFSNNLAGHDVWSQKPGIAIRYAGGEKLAAAITRNQPKMRDGSFLVCVEVPHDADKRWRARKPVRRRY